ncbi:MAG: LysR family transcriptional regulator, partial [Pseudomonadota bacterium]
MTKASVRPRKQNSAPNIRHLRIFSVIVHLGTVTAAANELNISQPAATQAIRSLEKRFGIALFTRAKTGVFLTEAGKLLEIRINRAFKYLNDIMKVGRRSREQQNAWGGRSLAMLTTVQLEAFFSIVRHGSVAAAARSSDRAQPTLHRAARELERVLEIDLFEPSSFGLRPTRAGEKVARCAGLFFHELLQADSEIATLLGRETGMTVIGAMPLARSHIVPKAVLTFMKTHPQHRVSILEAPYETLLTGMRRGDVDFLVGAMRDVNDTKDVLEQHLFNDSLSILMRP